MKRILVIALMLVGTATFAQVKDFKSIVVHFFLKYMIALISFVMLSGTLMISE